MTVLMRCSASTVASFSLMTILTAVAVGRLDCGLWFVVCGLLLRGGYYDDQ